MMSLTQLGNCEKQGEEAPITKPHLAVNLAFLHLEESFVPF